MSRIASFAAAEDLSGSVVVPGPSLSRAAKASWKAN